jgi:hypothetical protein
MPGFIKLGDEGSDSLRSREVQQLQLVPLVRKSPVQISDGNE